MINIVDLTSLFLQAYEQKENWSEETLVSTLRLLNTTFPFASLDWDRDAGESWARFLRRNDVFIYVRVNIPVVIVLSTYASKVESAISHHAVVISVPNMVAQNFSLDITEIGRLFPEHPWFSEVSPDGFSINELWYTTIT